MAIVDSWITRIAPLPTSNLHLLLPGVYMLAVDRGIGVRSITHRKVFAKSVWSDGATLVSQVKDLVKQTAEVQIFGATHADVETNHGPLLAAFGQTTYNLAVQLDTGVVKTWRCYVADVSEPFDVKFVKSRVATVTFSFDSDPNPITGYL